jgi:hypothetical protein
MGDRANVYIHEGNRPGVYLYTHWNGSELPSLVMAALQVPRALNRKNDTQYLTRILIEEIIGGDHGTETGWGVSAYLGDGSDRIIDVDVTALGPVVSLTGYEDEEEDEEYEDWCDCGWCVPEWDEDESHDDY